MRRFSALPATVICLLIFLFAGCGGPDNIFELASNPSAYGFFGVILLILDIIAIVELLKGNRGMISKLIWIALIVFLPFLGVILYYLIGRR